MNFGETRRKKVAINITSLVDILIVLLLFFMLTTQFVKMGALELSFSEKLPSKSLQKTQQNQEASVATGEETAMKTGSGNSNAGMLKIYLKGGGNFILNNIEFSLFELREKIEPLIRSQSNRNIVVVTTNEAEVQDLVTAMDVIKSVGGRNLSWVKE